MGLSSHSVALLIILAATAATANVADLGEGFAVLENACLSHVDGSVLVWPRDGSDEVGHGLESGSITPIHVRYHPFRGPKGMELPRSTVFSLPHPSLFTTTPPLLSLGQEIPGHPEYHPMHDHRSILIRAAPRGAQPPQRGRLSPNVHWRDGDSVSGALILGTFTMGVGTTRSRPGFDMYSSSWHGFLEPLVDAWAHVRRIAGGSLSPQSPGSGGEGSLEPLRCPRYDIFLTDEVPAQKSSLHVRSNFEGTMPCPRLG